MIRESSFLFANPPSISWPPAVDPAPSVPAKAQATELLTCGATGAQRSGETTNETRQGLGASHFNSKLHTTSVEDAHRILPSCDFTDNKQQRRGAPSNHVDRPLLNASYSATVPSAHSSTASVPARKNIPGSRVECPPLALFDPVSYTSLLPATLELRTVRGKRSNLVMGVAASEMFAAREARRLTGVSRPQRATHQVVPRIEIDGFEARMKYFQDRAKVNRHLWRTRLTGAVKPCTRASFDAGVFQSSALNNDVNSIHETSISCRPAEENDTSIRSDESAGEHSTQRPFGTKSQFFSRTGTPREYVNLKIRPRGNERGATLLRATIKESTAEVTQARYGHSPSMRLSHLPITQYKENTTAMEYGVADEFAGEKEKTDAESISWDTGIAKEGSQDENQKTSQRTSPVFGNANSVQDTTASSSRLPSARCLSTALHALLMRGKTSMVYGLDHVRDAKHKGGCPSVSLPLIPPTDHDASTDTASIYTRKIPTSKSRVSPQRRRQALPVKYGVGEHSRQIMENMIARHRAGEAEKERLRTEDIRRTRELMRKLMPERVRMLDESLAQSYENPCSVMEKHRQHIYQTASQMDALERRRDCAAYIDVLERWYCNEIVDSAWPAASNALQQARAMLMQNPPRRDARAFLTIVKDCFQKVHLDEKSVRDLLERLSLLFEMSKAQFKEVMAIVYQRLNRPKDYEARFRDIDRTIVGKPAEDIKLRVVLHRCRFLPSPTSGGNLGSDATAQESNLVVQLQTDHSSVTTTKARVKTCTEVLSPNSMQTVGKFGATTMSGVANLQGQTFRMQMTERFSIVVELLSDGKTIGKGEVHVSNSVFNSQGFATFWVRASGETCPFAEVKMTLELLKEKDRRMSAVKK